MKLTYTVQTHKYILKNFLYIFPFALIPALFLALSVANEEMHAIVVTFFTGRLNEWTFPELFHTISVLNFASWRTILSGFVGLIVIVPCMSLFTAFLEKHMRIGKRTFNGLWSKLNDNFPSTFLYGAVILFIYELWALMLAAMLYFLSLIPNLPTAYVLIVITFLSFHVLLFYAVGTIYLWLPCMQITGFPIIEALQYANQLVAPVRWGILLEQVSFLLVAETVVGICVCFLADTFLFTLVMTLIISMFILYYIVRMQVVYFDRDQIERKDLKKY